MRNFYRDPYYDDFDGNKNYHRLLFKPGYPVQSRELNLIQSTLKNQIKEFADHVFQSGSIVSNAQIGSNGHYYLILDKVLTRKYESMVIEGVNSKARAVIIHYAESSEQLFHLIKTDNGFEPGEEVLILHNDIVVDQANVINSGIDLLFSISDGVIYFRGSFINITNDFVPIGGSDDIKIGLYIIETRVTSHEDPLLKDPDFSVSTHGADRHQITAKLVKYPAEYRVGDNFILLAKRINGQMEYYKTDSEYAAIKSVFERRMYEQVGSFTLSPFRLTSLRNYLREDESDESGVFTSGGDLDDIYIAISGGLSYVKGKRIFRRAEQTLKIKRPNNGTRIDLIQIDSDGKIYNKKGIINSGVPPRQDTMSMPIYEIHFPEDSGRDLSVIRARYIDNRRYTMKDIGHIENRIKNVEYYTALGLLEKSAADMAIKDVNGLDRFKNGFIADNFNNWQAADLLSPEFRASVDFDVRELRPEFKAFNFPLRLDSRHSSNYIISDNGMATLPYQHEVFQENPYATKDVSINHYLQFVRRGQLTLTPNVDTWADDTIRPSVVHSVDFADPYGSFGDGLDLFGRHWGEWTELNRTLVHSDMAPSAGDNSGHYEQGMIVTEERTGVDRSLETRNRDYDFIDTITDVSLIPFMRGIDIEFHATGLKKNTNVYAFFEEAGIPTPVSEFCRQVNHPLGNHCRCDPLRSDENGELIGVFSVPAGRFFVGQKRFYITDDLSGSSDTDIETTFAEAVFFAGGLDITRQDYTLNVTTPKIVEEELREERDRDLPPRATTTTQAPVTTPPVTRPPATTWPPVTRPPATTWPPVTRPPVTQPPDEVVTTLPPAVTTTTQPPGIVTTLPPAVTTTTQPPENVSCEISVRAIVRWSTTGGWDHRLGVTERRWIDGASTWVAVSSTPVSASGTRRVGGIAHPVGERKFTISMNTPNGRVSCEASMTYATHGVDPIAQNFIVDDDCFISGLEVYFKQLDRDSDSIWIEVRDTVNGYPGSNVLARKDYQVDDLLNMDLESEDASKPFFIEFDSPIFLESNTEYSFIVGGHSPETRIWVSELGQTLVDNPNKILESPPTWFSSFRSVNSSTWNAYQNQAIKYRLHRASFNNEQPMILNFNRSNRADYVNLQNNPIEMKRNVKDVRIHVKNHGFTEGDFVKLDLFRDVMHEVEVNGDNIPFPGLTIQSATGKGVIRDFIQDDETFRLFINNIEGHFEGFQRVLFSYKPENIYDELLKDQAEKFYSNVVTFSGRFTSDAFTNRYDNNLINSVSVDEFTKLVEVKYSDSIDSFVIEVDATPTRSGFYGGSGIYIHGMNKKYELLNISGEYIAHNIAEEWKFRGLYHGSDTSLFAQENYMPAPEMNITIARDTYLERPFKLAAHYNEEKNTVTSFNLNGQFNSSTRLLSPVVNLSSFSAVIVSNRIQYHDRIINNEGSGGVYDFRRSEIVSQPIIPPPLIENPEPEDPIQIFSYNLISQGLNKIFRQGNKILHWGRSPIRQIHNFMPSYPELRYTFSVREPRIIDNYSVNIDDQVFSYVTKDVYLRNKAFDLVIYFDVFKDQYSNFDVFIKYLPEHSEENMINLPWLQLSNVQKVDSNDIGDRIEYELYASEHIEDWNPDEEPFIGFKVKITGRGKNSAVPPTFRSFRAIAIT